MGEWCKKTGDGRHQYDKWERICLACGESYVDDGNAEIVTLRARVAELLAACEELTEAIGNLPAQRVGRRLAAAHRNGRAAIASVREDING